MPQPFSPRANHLSRLSLWLAVVLSVVILGLTTGFIRSDYLSGRNDVIEQPVSFSHKHHVQGLGLDCRFCHTSVETSANAGIPDTQTCMTCHSEIWKTAEALKTVRESAEQNKPLNWYKVYRLPDYVYFNHSAHVAKGVGCTTCHGNVAEMPRIRQFRPFFMKSCNECHQHPEKVVRLPLHQAHSQNLTDCARCHR